MPSNNFSVGRDISLQITTSSGILTLDGLTGFSAKPMHTKLKSKAIDGKPRFGLIPDGWGGTFKMDRLSPVADNFWAAYEASYYSGNNQQAGTIYETIKEADGTSTQWRYTGVILTFDDAGDYAGDKKVEQSISFEADAKVKVA